jgi:ferredoxin-NADP reductase
MTGTTVPAFRQTVVPQRAPVAPRFAFPVIDRFVRARPARVLALEAETATIRRLRIERPAGYRFSAGQHALLRLGTEQGPDLRPLSLAGPPEGNTMEFATRTGTSAFKQAFVSLRPGDHVLVSRPMGGLAYDAARPAVFIAGGIGITPLRSLLLADDQHAEGAEVRLLFSNRSADEIPFFEELSTLPRRRPDLSITWILTAPPVGVLPVPVHVGRISADLLQLQAAELPDALFYVTGPAAMVSDLRTMLRSIGVARRRIRYVAQGYR